MAVEVRSARDGKRVSYPKATGIKVTEGHLHVTVPGVGGGGRAIAIFAPNEWMHAEVTDEDKA